MTLTTYAYLLSTLAILAVSYALRFLFFLNFTNPWRLAWLVGDEASITLLPGDAVRITITTRMKWRPGQYAYLRLPSVSLLVNHPFTITSLCTPGLPAHVYAPPRMAEGYRQMTFLLRPSSSYAQRLLAAADAQEAGDSFRAFLDGPYGGMSRALESFDHVLLIAGGSGITALMSQLVGLVSKMREGRAVTKSIRVVWAVKKIESLAWFSDDLRVYRDALRQGMLTCNFYITGERRARDGQEIDRGGAGVGMSVAPNGLTYEYGRRQETSSTQLSAKMETIINSEAGSHSVLDKELQIENEDAIAPLPQAHLKPLGSGTEPGRETLQQKRIGKDHLTVAVSTAATSPAALASLHTVHNQAHPLDQLQFHPQYLHTQTHFQHQHQRPQHNYLSAPHHTNAWITEHGRPDIRDLLRSDWRRDFRQRNCVFVCGPPGMRRDVAKGVAEAQRLVWSGSGRGKQGDGEEASRGGERVKEVWLHAENFAL